jgi:hypothetical protein
MSRMLIAVLAAWLVLLIVRASAAYEPSVIKVCRLVGLLQPRAALLGRAWLHLLATWSGLLGTKATACAAVDAIA